MPTKITFSRNLQCYAIDWESFEVQQFPIHDDMKHYVEALCASVLLEHDLA